MYIYIYIYVHMHFFLFCTKEKKKTSLPYRAAIASYHFKVRWIWANLAVVCCWRIPTANLCSKVTICQPEGGLRALLLEGFKLTVRISFWGLTDSGFQAQKKKGLEKQRAFTGNLKDIKNERTVFRHTDKYKKELGRTDCEQQSREKQDRSEFKRLGTTH